MFKILFSLLLSLFVVNPSWAYLTAGKIAVTSTSSSSGVSSTSQDSDCTDILGVSLTCPVVANFPQICLNGVCETAWPAGGSQTTGSSILAGNGLGGYTNVTLSKLQYSTGTLSVIANVNLNGNQYSPWTSVQNFNTAYQAATDGLVSCTGAVSGSAAQINGYSNASSSPASGTLIAQTFPVSSQAGNISFAVAKGEYYECTMSGVSSDTVFFKPSGS